jgi:hypothetical protein
MSGALLRLFPNVTRAACRRSLMPQVPPLCLSPRTRRVLDHKKLPSEPEHEKAEQISCAALGARPDNFMAGGKLRSALEAGADRSGWDCPPSQPTKRPYTLHRDPLASGLVSSPSGWCNSIRRRPECIGTDSTRDFDKTAGSGAAQIQDLARLEGLQMRRRKRAAGGVSRMPRTAWVRGRAYSLSFFEARAESTTREI